MSSLICVLLKQNPLDQAVYEQQVFITHGYGGWKVQDQGGSVW